MDRGALLRSVFVLKTHQPWDQRADQRCVAGKKSRVADVGAKEDRLHVGLKHDPLGSHETGRERCHGDYDAPDSSCLAFSSTDSTPPTFKNACSGTSSSSPPKSASKDSTVSSIGTVTPWQAGEHLADEERLGQEALDLPRPVDGQAVLFGELVEAEDGDDVLQLPVALEHLLDAPGARRSGASPTTSGAKMLLVEASGSTAG